MQKRKLFLSLLLAVMVAIILTVFVACNDNNSDTPPKEYTVTFDSAGGSSVDAQKVKSGDKAVEPSNPEKEDYVFKGWYIGDVKYDFSLAVTENLTLTAKWEENLPTLYTLTFDSNGGSSIDSITVESGVIIVPPQENPTRSGYYFEGWFVGDDRYEFFEPLTGDVTVKAKWSDVQKVDSDFIAALNADYSNFASDCIVSDNSGASYTDIFKQTEDMAYWIPGSALFEEHIIFFDEEGRMLAMYYLYEDEWKKSGLVSYADFVVALYLDEIELDDVAYQGDGVYRVYDESVASIVYALFRSNDSYIDFYIQVADGHIAKVWGNLAGEDGISLVQTFYDFGETVIDIPSVLPAVAVSIETKIKETEVGVALDADELISFLFTVKVEGKDYAITSDMVSFGELDFDNPVEGVYPVTLSFGTWDGATHTETATVKVIEVQTEETFADVFAKDYSNVTITNPSTKAEFKYVNGCYFNAAATNYYYFVEADKTMTQYQYTKGSEPEQDTAKLNKSNYWFSTMPRVDMLFALSSDIFEQVDDNTYVAKNDESLIPVLTNYLLMSTYKFNALRDYSITLTVEAGRVQTISLSCYYVTASTTPTATNGTARNGSFTLSNFGATEIEIPDAVKALREDANQASADMACADDKRYIA